MTSRRNFLYGMMAAPLALRSNLSAALLNVGNNPTWAENQKAGTPAWQIGQYPYVNSNDNYLYIRGYASATSINRGEKITFNVTVNPYIWKPTEVPVPYVIDVYRVGWYNGDGGRLMKHLGPFNGVQQPGGTQTAGVTSPPPVNADTGMIELKWTGDGLGNGSYTLDTSLPPDGSTTNDWTSGIYLALLTTRQSRFSPTDDPDHQSYIIFVIREDSRHSDILFQQAVATYQAYNNYPDDNMNGKSLYDAGSYGPMTTIGTQRAVKVSFDRPYTYTDHTGAGDFLHWELYFVRWLERNGYDVTYSTDVDTHVNGTALLNHKTFLSVGHGEYWSREMVDAVEAARDKGTSLGFFGANAVYNQIRFEASTSGAPNRVIVCYKDAALDPVNNPSNSPYNPSLTTITFRSSLVNRPEQRLVGVMYDDYFDAEAPALSYVVQNSSHWLYAGTGFKDGTKAPGILGYEMDRQFAEYPLPASIAGTYALLSNSPYTGSSNGPSTSQASIYQAVNGPGAWVLGAGTIDWSFGLDGYLPPSGINTRGVPALSDGIQQVTANFLNRTTGRLSNPTGLTTKVPANGKFRISLSWTNNAALQTGVLIERSLDGTRFVQLAVVSATSVSYMDTAVDPAIVYYYRAAAFDALTTSAYSNVAVQGPLPAAPSGLGATPISDKEIDLMWVDKATNEITYYVEISTDNSQFSQLAVLPANSTFYNSLGLASGKTYYYRVRAQNQFGFSPYSGTAAATTFGPPAAPSKLSATAASTTQINLAWQDNSKNESGFQIWRSSDGLNFVGIGSVSAGVKTFANIGLTSNTKYYYQVTSYNSYGSSAASNTATATTKAK